MLTSKIENLIDELPQASNQRVEEIVKILEGVLSDIECRFPSEDDIDIAYECQNIPKAQDIIALIRAWNVRDMENVERKYKEDQIKMINKLSKELKIIFTQICPVSADLG